MNNSDLKALYEFASDLASANTGQDAPSAVCINPHHAATMGPRILDLIDEALAHRLVSQLLATDWVNNAWWRRECTLGHGDILVFADVIDIRDCPAVARVIQSAGVPASLVFTQTATTSQALVLGRFKKSQLFI